MDFLVDNPLVRMPGYVFLILYGITILLTALAIKAIKSNLDWTAKLPLPLVPQNPNPYEIAYLRGGANELARAVVFALKQKGFLEILIEDKKSLIRLAQNQPNWTTLPAIERSVLPWFQTTHETKEVFAKNGIIEILKPYAEEFERNAVQSNFLMPSDVAAKTKMLAGIAAFALFISGFYKVIVSVLSGHSNIFFTVILTILAGGILLQLGKTRRLSNLGQRYIERIQQAFENLKTQVQNPLTETSAQNLALATGNPYLLAVGVFGIAALSGTMYHDYKEAFQQANSYNSGSSCGSGGCGSSSCSSGDGGSGCGGGCGGCGGS